jgi:ATP/ADP translocase
MINRIIGDSLLLARVGVQVLPLMLVVGAITVGGISFVWARRTRHVSVFRLVLTTQLSGTALTLCLVLLLLYAPSSSIVVIAIYVLAELRGCFNLILISTLLNEHFCSKSQHGPYAFVNAGSPVAGIATGFLVGIEAGEVSPEFLLGLCCVFDTVTVMIASRVATKQTDASFQEWQTHSEPGIVDTLNKPTKNIDKRLRTFTNALMAVVITKTVVLSIVAFEWKVMADRALGHDEESLERYFGLFYAISDALILAIQLCLTRSILSRLGIRLSLLILPISLVGAGMFSLLTSNVRLLFAALTVARGSMVLRRSIHDVAVQIIYGAMPRRVRRGVVAKVLGIAKPISEAIAAGLVGLFATAVPIRTFAWFWMPFLAVWLFYTLRLGIAWEQVVQSKESAHQG